MLDKIASQLAHWETWAELLLLAAVGVALYRTGNAVRRWLRAKVEDSELKTALRWLRLPWTLTVVFCWLAVGTRILNLGELPLLYAAGESVLEFLRATLGQVLVILALLTVAWSLIGPLTAHITGAEGSRESVRLKTLRGVLSSALKVIAFVAALVALLQVFGINPASLLAGVSVLGLAVSFGAQNLVRDVLNGFFFLLEDQFGVGDRITINTDELTGDVENLNLRVTTLRHRQSGALHIIPNGEIKKVTVERKGRNWNRVEALARLSYGDDLDLGLKVFEQVCQDLYQDEAWHKHFTDEPIVQGVHELGDSEIYLRCLFTVHPTMQGRVKREFNRRVKLAFDAAGLDIAPKRTTTFGNTLEIRQAAESPDATDPQR